MNTMTIGKLAHDNGLATETLRHYERLGLIAPSQRSASNYRLYDQTAAQRLRFIRRAQALGFSLPEIRELLGLHADADMGAVKARTWRRRRMPHPRGPDPRTPGLRGPQTCRFASGPPEGMRKLGAAGVFSRG
ncbi:hypothetical protein CARN8_820009 [mine drainage metagenome]|uniref:HTH merR-type domain-containing protein n=1 Tax=mine drainage metagenome TaxID=410659 RepID=E6PTA5_9ZZZZ